MKKIIIYLLTIATLFTITACQATPETPLVVGKNQEKMIEQAKATPQETSQETQSGKPENTVSIKTLLGVPDLYEYTNAKGNLHISLNAKVKLPDVGSMPVVRVRPAEFSQEQATTLFNYFCSGKQMVDRRMFLTKAEIEKFIVGQKKILAQAETENDEWQINESKNTIADLEKKYRTAPENIGFTPTDGKLRTIEQIDYNYKVYARFQGIDAIELDSNGAETWGTFTLGNNSSEEISRAYGNGGGYGGYASYRSSELKENYQRDRKLKGHIDLGYVPDKDKNILLTAAQAAVIAQDLFDINKMPFAVTDIWLLDDGQKDNISYAYEMTCNRIVDGAPVVNINDVSSEDSTNNAYAKVWTYESVKILINDKGIMLFDWYSPMAILETEVEQSKMLSFEKITAVFEKMIEVQNEPLSKNKGIKSYDIIIEDVSLELMRINESNSVDSGLLIPSWRFYGYINQHFTDSSQDYLGGYKCLMTINAIDGSIIDVQRGY